MVFSCVRNPNRLLYPVKEADYVILPSSVALDSVASTFAGLPSVDDVLNHLFSDDSICSHDAVLLIDSPGVRLLFLPAPQSLILTFLYP
jgi:hypothetical protein